MLNNRDFSNMMAKKHRSLSTPGKANSSKINKERRRSSFTTSSSPCARRNSFLSESMINDEKHSVYESVSNWSSNGLLSFNISLKESQGFVWNQDLFASPYQQSRSLFNEKKYETLSSSFSSSSSMDEDTDNDSKYKVEVTDIIIQEDELDELFD